MGHGNYSEPDTFVPAGGKVGIYAGVDTVLAITIGMAVLAQPGGYESVTTYDSTDGRISPIHNYRVGPLTHPEFQRMRTVDSVKNKIIYVGYDERFMTETQLCTDLAGCGAGQHRCDGLLGRITDADNDIRLAFCLGSERRSGLASMTTVFPSTQAYTGANAHLEEYLKKAKDWYDRITADPDQEIPEFHRLATSVPGAREAAFILASSKSLDELLMLHDAREQRRKLTAGSFLNYLYGVPEKSRGTIVAELRKDPVTALDLFVDSFFAATTQQRCAAWADLTPEEQQQAAGNQLIGPWAAGVVPVVARYQRLADSADQPAGWFEAAALRTGLSEYGEDEAQTVDAYRDAINACMEFGASASPAARLALWARLDGNQDAQRMLSTVTNEGLADWKVPGRPGDPADPLEAWLATYRERLWKAAQSAGSDVPGAGKAAADAASESSDETEDLFEDYWDDLDTANQRAARGWVQQQVVQLIEDSGRFKFAERTPAVEAAFPQARWTTFEVTALTMSGATLTEKGNVDRAAFGSYLEALATGTRTVITLN
ncbi:hypothetical protein ASE03_29060 [Kitasatospora sp. Root187]|nr:hypothetical protein ASC99_32315 [Kitasatospora sp. Root107]KRB68948.1 hypothetical protein ASE03_29060 [Kitasatospora sp. Root187]